eukprot:SAG31_NODE_37021_length_308_cov_0.736842_1_plen_34_part_10
MILKSGIAMHEDSAMRHAISSARFHPNLHADAPL